MNFQQFGRLLLALSLLFHGSLMAQVPKAPATSTAAQAVAYLDSISHLDKSHFWPNVDPGLLLDNLRTFTTSPFAFHEGKPTNFCAYSALTYLPLTYDPLGFSKFMIHLFKYGEARMGKTVIKPGMDVRKAAGLLKYKAELDINPAGQMWFLSLADHFKGYLNFFNRRFQMGDENTFWASTNFAKFNRMTRRLFPGTIKSVGADLIRPKVSLYAYIAGKINDNEVFLYINNKKLYRKRHSRSFIKTPTHYILLTHIARLPGDKIEIVYWDYGRLTLQQLPASLFRDIVYGITSYNPKKRKT
ncbi:hypothetical protein GCM10027051_12530 [Niabella terrae]